MRTSISNANMCQPDADYVCDWKPLDNALHASSFSHLVFYIIYIYMWRREDELARITGKWMQWDLLGGTCCWPDSVYTHFFSLSLSPFFSVECESSFFPSLLFFLLSWLVTAIPCRPHSNYRNGPTSLLSPLFFFFLLARSPRALSFLVSVASSSFSLAFFFILDSPMHQSILSSFFSSLSPLLSMSPTSQHKKKLGRARKRGGWTPRANPWTEKAEE